MATPPPPMMTIEEILATALDKERQARDFYGSLALQCPVEPVRELLQKLENEEHKHFRMIEEMQVRLNLGLDPVSHVTSVSDQHNA